MRVERSFCDRPSRCRSNARSRSRRATTPEGRARASPRTPFGLGGGWRSEMHRRQVRRDPFCRRDRHGRPETTPFPRRPVSNRWFARSTRPPLPVPVPDHRRSKGVNPPDMSNGSGYREGLYRVRRRSENRGSSRFTRVSDAPERHLTAAMDRAEPFSTPNPRAWTPRTRADRPRSDHPSLSRRSIASDQDRNGYASTSPYGSPTRRSPPKDASPPRSPFDEERFQSIVGRRRGGVPRWTAPPPACEEAAWGEPQQASLA